EPPREIDTAAPAHGGRRRRWRRDIAFGEHRHVDDHGGASGGLFRRHEARAIRRRSSDIDRAWIDQLADLRAWLYDAPADRDREAHGLRLRHVDDDGREPLFDRVGAILRELDAGGIAGALELLGGGCVQVPRLAQVALLLVTVAEVELGARRVVEVEAALQQAARIRVL